MSDHETHLLSTSRFDVVEVPADPANPDGKKRQILRHPGAVTILPLVDDDHICLIRNYRVSVGKELLELPAGTLEPNEPHAVTAKRELIEETGFDSTVMLSVRATPPPPRAGSSGSSARSSSADAAGAVTYTPLAQPTKRIG